MKILALIPARSGSKSIQHKNLQPVLGKPLLVHSIDHAVESSLIDRVLVSTDSEEYAAIAAEAGAEVPFLRPAEYATDESSDLDVFQHALDWLQEHEGAVPDIIVHLRPTYPIRRIEDIDEAIQVLLDNPQLDSVRSVTTADHPPYKSWFRSDDGLLSPVVQTDIPDAHNLPRQLLPQTYAQNACIDVVRSSVVLEQNSTTGSKIYGYLMDHNFDIDLHSDLHRVRTAQEAKAAPERSDNKRVFCFDIDGVIATIVPDGKYEAAQPRTEMIDVIRKLYTAGHTIILNTARGTVTGKNWREVTEQQLASWNVPYHELHFGKPAADFYIDDRSLSMDTVLDSSFLAQHE